MLLVDVGVNFFQRWELTILDIKGFGQLFLIFMYRS